jgi:hypothetical protein
MRSASMLLASSGMLPDDLCACCKSYELLRSRSRAVQPAGWQLPARASRMLALPNPAALLTWPRHGDHEFAVLLGDKVFGAAG